MWMRVFTIGVMLLYASPDAATQSVEPESMRCWWRTSAGAVATGEPFTLTLTCAVLDNEATVVRPDEARLTAASISLPPFEVLDGTHSPDLRAGQRRFFQYDYTLRLIDPDLIGKDARLPDLQIHYRVESRQTRDSSVEGRDRIYVLPGIPIRVLSLVPADAADIRESAGASFAPIAAWRFRARLFQLLAYTVSALALVALALALARILGVKRRATSATTAYVVEGTLPRELASELRRIQQQSGHGWTQELISRALTCLRLAAGVAIGQRTRQRVITEDMTLTDGGLILSVGRRSPRRVLLVSAVTTTDLQQALDAATPAAARDGLETLRDAMASFTAAAYASNPEIEQARLDETLRDAIEAVDRMRRAARWPSNVFTRAQALWPQVGRP